MNADSYYHLNKDYYRTNYICIDEIRKLYNRYDSYHYNIFILGIMGLYETILLRNLI